MYPGYMDTIARFVCYY